MIRHVVVFRWAGGVTTEQVEHVRAGLSALPARIPEIVGYSMGPDARIASGNMDFALVADFASPEAFLVYRTHPDHQDVIDERISPLLGERASVQFEIPD